MNTSKLLRVSALVVGLAAVSGITAIPALAVDNMSSGDIDLSSVRAKIKAKDYASALSELRDLADETPNADVYNLLGFTLRKSGDYATALTYYNRALDLEPDHKAAREYLGELFVETGDLDKANEQLARLVRLCPNRCEERDDLQRALGARAGK
ncbi:MAG TPA: tetratricopeptide repeat protein [Sphingomicrobium sp.]|nr:tetratricopeptide repeat protein [Sphingomicrobium sp.]